MANKTNPAGNEVINTDEKDKTVTIGADTLKILEERLAQLEAKVKESPQKSEKVKASAIPEQVIENEKKMREIVEFYVPIDPVNRTNTDIKVINPLNESLMILKRGERVKIPRCVYEILQHSDEQNIVIAGLTEKLAREYEEAEKKN